MQKSAAGAWSFYGSFAALALAAYLSGGFGILFPDLATYFTGGALSLPAQGLGLLTMFAVIFAVVVIELPCCIIAGHVQQNLLGDHGKHAVGDMLDRMREGHLFTDFFTLVLLEELFARWLFLGVLTKIPGLDGPFAFYALMLVGNGLWALMHLGNFKEKGDRHWLRVLPQFVSGIFFAYVFVKFGLLAAVLVHFVSNALLFSLHKVQNFSGTDLLIMAYSAFLAAVSYWLMDKPLTDALVWFHDSPSFVIEGWSFWDYLKYSVFVSAVLGLVFDLLLYDRTATDKGTEEKKEGPGLIGIVLIIALFLGILYAAYWALGFVVASSSYRALILAILLSFTIKSASGSAMARTFWVSLPNLYLAVCILEALGFWWSLAFLAVEMVIHLPLSILKKIDD